MQGSLHWSLVTFIWPKNIKHEMEYIRMKVCGMYL
jgi:hypothetical protein